MLARALAEADRSHAAGDASGRATHRERAVTLWRGEPLADLAPLADSTGEVEAVRRSLVDATLQLGELRLAAGRAGDALRCAERARGAAPYDERPYRLVMAAHLQRRDRASALAGVAATEDMLAELGARPEESTAMLIRQVRHRTSVPAAGVVDLNSRMPAHAATG